MFLNGKKIDSIEIEINTKKEFYIVQDYLVSNGCSWISGNHRIPYGPYIRYVYVNHSGTSPKKLTNSSYKSTEEFHTININQLHNLVFMNHERYCKAVDEILDL